VFSTVIGNCAQNEGSVKVASINHRVQHEADATAAYNCCYNDQWLQAFTVGFTVGRGFASTADCPKSNGVAMGWAGWAKSGELRVQGPECQAKNQK